MVPTGTEPEKALQLDIDVGVSPQHTPAPVIVEVPVIAMVAPRVALVKPIPVAVGEVTLGVEKVE
jgi:hypothetical protein